MDHTSPVRMWPYVVAVQIMSLIPCIMLIYVRIGTERWIQITAAILAFTLLALPLMLYLLAWIIDVYLREMIVGLICMLRGQRGVIDLRRILRLPSTRALMTAVIVQMMYACMMIGMMIWPVLRRMYA